MLDLKAIRERCFPEDGPKTPPTPQEVEELIWAVQEAREIVSNLRDRIRFQSCYSEDALKPAEAWLARFK